MRAYFETRPNKLVKLTDLGGDKCGFYTANMKTQLILFILEELSIQLYGEPASYLDITEDRYEMMKSLRVSKFTLDELFEIAYRLGYSFNLQPVASSTGE